MKSDLSYLQWGVSNAVSYHDSTNFEVIDKENYLSIRQKRNDKFVNIHQQPNEKDDAQRSNIKVMPRSSKYLQAILYFPQTLSH